VLRLLSGCRYARAESVVGSVAVRWLRRADLGTEEIAYRTAQNLYSLHRSRRFHETRAANARVTDATKFIEAQRPVAPKTRFGNEFGNIVQGSPLQFQRHPHKPPDRL
jgi:hypothetical protein